TAVFLANQAVIALDAIGRTLHRLFISRRHLLEWETAAAAEARLGNDLRSFVRLMLGSVITAAGLGVLVSFTNNAAIGGALPWLLAWLYAPIVAYWVSRPLPEVEPPLTPEVRAELRRTARKTWRF